MSTIWGNPTNVPQAYQQGGGMTWQNGGLVGLRPEMTPPGVRTGGLGGIGGGQMTGLRGEMGVDENGNRPSGSVQQGEGGSPTNQSEADVLARMRRDYPWLPEVLLTAYVDAWIETGDHNAAWSEMRAHPRYDEYFAGNRRTDGALAGTFRYDEQTYLAVRDGMGLKLADYGQNPDAYSQQITAAIAGDVSVQEFAERLDLLWTQMERAIPQVRQAYIDEFGLSAADPEVTDANIFGSFLNPGADLTELRVRVTNAQIVGNADALGFNRSFARAEELQRAGLTGENAATLYQQAAIQLPTLSAFAARYYDPNDDFGIDDFEEAITGLDPKEAERAQRLIGWERSNFAQRGQVARDQTGALTGLSQA